MLVKAGVDISRLEPPIRKKLNKIASILYGYCGQELIITSTYEGNHCEGSLHYGNLAVDIRRIGLSKACIAEIINCLGDDYDVIVVANYIHIEYDPK